MAFIPVPATARVSMLFSLAGQTVVVTFHAHADDNVMDSGTLEDLADAAVAWHGGYLKYQQSNAISLTSVNVVDQTDDSGASFTLPVSPAVAGDVAQASLSANVAACISWRTGYRGRSYRGRMYVPGLPVTFATDAVLMTAGAASGLATSAAGLATELAGVACSQVIASRYHNNAPRVTGVFTPVISYVIDRLLDSQRRRLSGRGT